MFNNDTPAEYANDTRNHLQKQFDEHKALVREEIAKLESSLNLYETNIETITKLIGVLNRAKDELKQLL
jgi:exonuclease VII small subunit